MGKYDPLRDWLRTKTGRVTLSFEEVADLVGGLPSSAYHRPEWWENNDYRHVQAVAWLSAGMEVAGLDLPRRVVSFVPR